MSAITYTLFCFFCTFFIVHTDTLNGFSFEGIDGRSLSYGDFNGDNFADIIIGSPALETTSEQIYVMFGKNTHLFSSTLDLNNLNGVNGFTIKGIAESEGIGYSISVGDVNGDSFDDILIGTGGYTSWGSERKTTGRSYVIFGSNTDSFSSSFDLNTLNGFNGFTITGIPSDDDYSKYPVSFGGDVNGDGFDDILISSPYVADSDANDSPAEIQIFVIFGRKSPLFSASFDLNNLKSPNGFIIRGITKYYNWLPENSISVGGDINGDGFDDILVGVYYADSNGIEHTGQTHVIYGGNTLSFPASLHLKNLNGSNGFTINGILNHEHIGYSVSFGGDMNGDGFDDILIGSDGGRCYVVFGRTTPFEKSFDLNSLDGTNGFVLEAFLDYFSERRISFGGDVNGDGIDDILISTYYIDIEEMDPPQGWIYIIFGRATPSFPSKLRLDSLKGETGFIIDFTYYGFGGPVMIGGDVNGDSFDDILLGDYGVIFGRNTSQTPFPKTTNFLEQHL